MSGAAAVDRASRALMAGNFAIGCGVMVVAGSLNDLSAALQVAPAVAGQLITAGAVAMGVGAPLLAAAFSGWDRRRLLTLALLWFGAGHALAALAPGFAALLPLRVFGVLGAAVFTPQAAAAINVLAPPGERGRAMALVFMGWSLASVVGMPLASLTAEVLGWRWAFGGVAVLNVLAAAAVWRSVPDGVRPPPLSLASWRSALTDPLLMAIVAVTALASAGQFTLFSYLAPYYRQVVGASAGGVSLLFFWFGACGLAGALLLTRAIDRAGAARCVNVTLAAMALSMAAWPLSARGGGSGAMALVLLPWGAAIFACNSAQQARLAQAAPPFAPALLALNTSAIYVGQALGAAGGGALLMAGGFAALSPAALTWMLAALLLSVWAARGMRVRTRAA